MKYFVTISAVVAGILAGVTAQTVVRPMPPALVSLEVDSVSAFNLLLDRKWDAALPVVDRIAANQAQVTAPMVSNRMAPSMAYVFESLVYQLRVLTRDRSDPLMAARVANQLSILVLDVQEHYPAGIPLDLPRLDYLGREIALLASRVQDFGLLRLRVLEFEQVWTRVRPLVNQRGGERLSVQMDEVIAGLRLRTTRDQVIRNTSRIFALEDEMEKLF